MAEKVMSREEKMAPVIAKAWQDANFKKQLLADPKGVINKEFGVNLPASIKLTVLEEAADKLYLVIPAKPAAGELSEDQLESVAGGACLPVAVCVGAAAAGGAAGAGAAQGKRHGW